MPAFLEAALALVGVEPPFFLRQLRRATDWGDAVPPLDQRVEDAARAVFRVDQPAHSLFEIRDADDLRRVVVALCANRLKPAGSKFFFVGVSRAELAAAGVHLNHTPEDARRVGSPTAFSTTTRPRANRNFALCCGACSTLNEDANS